MNVSMLSGRCIARMPDVRSVSRESYARRLASRKWFYTPEAPDWELLERALVECTTIFVMCARGDVVRAFRAPVTVRSAASSHTSFLELYGRSLDVPSNTTPYSALIR